MTISFTCPNCEKCFTIDAKLGGKKGRCKQCGTMMMIPDDPRVRVSRNSATSQRQIDSSRGTHVSRNDRFRTSSSEPNPTVRRSPRPSRSPDAEPEVDVYGFDDERLPPQTPQSFDDESVVENGPPVPYRKKRKKVGFFAGSRKNSSSRQDSSGLSPLALRIMWSLFGIFIFPMIYGAINGLSPRSEIETYYKTEIDQAAQFLTMLQRVTDLESAQQSGPAIRDHIRKMTEYSRTHMKKRGLQRDIDRLTAKYQPIADRTNKLIIAEIARLGTIEGVLEALDLEESINELSEVEAEIQNLKIQENR